MKKKEKHKIYIHTDPPLRASWNCSTSPQLENNANTVLRLQQFNDGVGGETVLRGGLGGGGGGGGDSFKMYIILLLL